MEQELAMWIINGLLGLLLLIIGYVVKDVINTQKEHAKLIESNTRQINENKSAIKSNTDMDYVKNDQITKTLQSIKEGMEGFEKRMIAEIGKLETISTNRLNRHSDEIKNLNARIIKLESKSK